MVEAERMQEPEGMDITKCILIWIVWELKNWNCECHFAITLCVEPYAKLLQGCNEIVWSLHESGISSLSLSNQNCHIHHFVKKMCLEIIGPKSYGINKTEYSSSNS